MAFQHLPAATSGEAVTNRRFSWLVQVFPGRNFVITLKVGSDTIARLSFRQGLTLNHEIRPAYTRRQPLRLDRQLCFPLYAATNLLTRVYRPVLEPLGLTYSQYLVMLVLWERSPVSVGDLGECLYLENGTLTPLLKRMEQGGFISRRRDTEDERRVLVTLTPHGHDLRDVAKTVPETLSSIGAR